MPNLPIPVKKKKENTYSQANAGFYNSKVWREMRKRIIWQTPYCAVCKIDCTRNGHVDHIVRISSGGAQLDLNNLWLLCKHHHDKKSYLESRGYNVEKTVYNGQYIPTLEGLDDLIQKLQ